MVNQALEMAKEEMLIIDTQDDINDWYFNHSNKGIKNWLFLLETITGSLMKLENT